NGVIDTSHDADNDGLITIDCNDNNRPDDLLDVMTTPCTNGRKQEFYGLDDECVLFTTNTGAEGGVGRPLALGPGSYGDFGPSDAWAGRYTDGVFYRINGKTGKIITTVTPPSQPSTIAPASCNAPADCGQSDYYWDCVSNKCRVKSHPYGAAIDQF